MPDAVTRYVQGLPMEQIHWYEDPNSIAELYEWLAERGLQPLNVSAFIRHAYDWEPQYASMRAHQGRTVMLEQARACRDASMGKVALKDDKGGTDAQSAA